MGMTDDFESSLQVLRGFDTDITVEVNEIKVNFLMLICVHQTSSGKYLFTKIFFQKDTDQMGRTDRQSPKVYF